MLGFFALTLAAPTGFEPAIFTHVLIILSFRSDNICFQLYVISLAVTRKNSVFVCYPVHVDIICPI